MDWDNSYYVRLYKSQSPDWLALPVLTRGLFAEIMLIADRGGRIPLGKAGLSSVAVPLRADWSSISDHVTALIADGCLVHEPGALVIPNFVDAQATAKTAAERQAAKRERDKEDAAKKAGKEKDVTKSHGASRGSVTERDTSRPVTGVTDVTLQTNKQTEQTEQTDLPQPPHGGGEGSVPDVGPDPTEAELFAAYTRGLNDATGTLSKPARTEANAYALTTLWGTVGYPEGYTAADFLAKLPAKVVEYVAEAKRRGQPDRFEGFYSPKRFLDYTQAVLDGRDPWPGLGTSGDGKARQGGKAANGGGMSSPYGDPTAEDIARMTGGAS